MQLAVDSRRAKYALLVLFVLWATWLTLEYFAFGRYSYVELFDNGDSPIPGRLRWVNAVKNGTVGQWDPYQLSGVDEAATGSATEIDTFLFLFLPGWAAYAIFTWIQRFVASFGTYLLLKHLLKTNSWAALWGALVYSFYLQPYFASGFRLIFGLSMPALPLMIWMLYHFAPDLRKIRILVFVGFGIVLGLTTLYVFMPFMFGAVILFVVFVKPNWSKAFWFGFLCLIAGWVVASVPALAAGTATAPLSHRLSWDMLDPYLGTQLFFQTLVIPHLRLNLGAIILAFMGMILGRGRDRRLNGLLVIAIALCLFLTFYYQFLEFTAKTLGFKGFFQFSYVWLIVPFFFIIPGAVGLDILLRFRFKTVSRRVVIALKIVICSIFYLSVGLDSIKGKLFDLEAMARGSNFATLYEQPALAEIAQQKNAQLPFRVATVLGTDTVVHDATFPTAYGLEIADGYSPIYSNRYKDYWKRVITPVLASSVELSHTFVSWGSKVYLFTNGKETDSAVTLDQNYNLSLLSLANVKYLISSKPLIGDDYHLVWHDTGATFVLWQTKPFVDQIRDMLAGYFPQVPFYIYQNNKVQPRFFWVSNTRLFDDDNALLAALGQTDDLYSTVYLLRSDISGVPLDQIEEGSGQIDLVRYGADDLKLNTHTTQNSLLIVTTNYSTWWHATVDNSDVRIFPAYHTFQGIYLPAGDHTVALRYAPPYPPRYFLGSIGVSLR